MTDEFDNLEPLIPAGDEWPDIPIGEVSVTFAVFPGGATLAQAVDLATLEVGRFGVDRLDMIIEETDNPDRRWLVRDGSLYDLSELGLNYAGVEKLGLAPVEPDDDPDA